MSSDIIWGIGIENETMIFSGSQNISGSDLVEKNKMDYLKPFIDNEVISVNCNYKMISSDDYMEDFGDEVIDSLSDDIFIKNPNLEELILRYYRIIGKKEGVNRLECLIYFFKKIHNRGSLDYDSTNTREVNEFVTRRYQNRNIKQYIEEIYLAKTICKEVLETLNDKKYYYPRIGSIYPIENDGLFTQDYTGSYHLNLSLPYSSEKLENQKVKYESNKNKIINNLSKYEDLNSVSPGGLAAVIYKDFNKNMREMVEELGFYEYTKEIDDFFENYLLLRKYRRISLDKLVIICNLTTVSFYYFIGQKSFRFMSYRKSKSIFKKQGLYIRRYRLCS